MILRAIDFETTGEPTETDPHAVCEVGFCDVVDGELRSPVGMLVNPGRPVDPGARAIHHIGDMILIDAMPITRAFATLMEGPPDYFVAHNADFEQAFFGGGNVPWICSYKVALRLWPDAPSHSLGVLRYWLDLDIDQALGLPAHRAGPDAYVGAALMQRILVDGRASFDEMVRWSKGPALQTFIRFGKHKGSRWIDLPSGYLRWMLEEAKDVDRDARANAKYWLQQKETTS